MVIVADVYPAGEAPIEGVEPRRAWSRACAATATAACCALAGPAALPALVAEEAKAGDLVVCLGAGDITAWAYALPAAARGAGGAA